MTPVATGNTEYGRLKRRQKHLAKKARRQSADRKKAQPRERVASERGVQAPSRTKQKKKSRVGWDRDIRSFEPAGWQTQNPDITVGTWWWDSVAAVRETADAKCIEIRFEEEDRPMIVHAEDVVKGPHGWRHIVDLDTAQRECGWSADVVRPHRSRRQG